MTRPLSRMRSTTSARPVGWGARWTPAPPPRVVNAVVAMLVRASYFLLEVALAREREPLLLGPLRLVPLLLRRPLPDVDLELERLRGNELLPFVPPPLLFCLVVARRLRSSSSSSSCSSYSSSSRASGSSSNSSS